MTTAGDLKKVTGEKDRTMGLTRDEGDVIVESLLDDLDAIGRFVAYLQTVEIKTLAEQTLYRLSMDTMINISLDKVEIIKMLIDSNASRRPNPERMKVLDKWDRIVNETIEAVDNDT
jgi:hypothetical protein